MIAPGPGHGKELCWTRHLPPGLEFQHRPPTSLAMCESSEGTVVVGGQGPRHSAKEGSADLRLLAV